MFADPDEALLQRFAGGDRRALQLLAERYEPALLGLAQGLLGGDRALACDAVQETWLRVIRFAGTFNGHSSARTWLYRIAINQCRSLAAARGASLEPEPATRTAAAEDAASAAARHEQHGRLGEAVARLDPDRRETVLLCYHRGLTHTEAAELLRIPLGTLKSRLHAALEELRATLGPEARP